MSEDADLLRDALTARLARADAGSVWAALGDAGIHGLRVAADQGGAGADPATAAVVADVLGGLCLPSAFIECCALATLAGNAAGESADALRTALVAGECPALIGLEPALAQGVVARAAGAGYLASGTARLVLDGAAAALLVLATDDGIWLARSGAGVSAHGYATLDGRMAADVTFSDASAQPIRRDGALAWAAARDEAIILLAVEAAALMRALVDQTVTYARQREQFGQPIGKFQAVQHRLVDMHIAARRAGAIARAAVAAADGPTADRARIASAAKATINETGRFVGQQAVQLHGGMGMTEELPVGRYFKRLTVIETQLGSTGAHLASFGTAMAAGA